MVMYVMSSYSNTLNTKRHSFQVHSTLCFFEACSVLVRQHCKVVCCRRSNDRGSRRERERKPKKDKDSGGWPFFFIKFPLPVIKTPLKAHGLSAFIRLTMDNYLKYVDFEWKPGTTHDNLKLPRLGVQHGTAHLAYCSRQGFAQIFDACRFGPLQESDSEAALSDRTCQDFSLELHLEQRLKCLSGKIVPLDQKVGIQKA